jgi:hypothetical protein
MFRTVSLVTAVMVSCASVAMAQNARIEAMGGVNIIDDIGAIPGAPADINDFVDVVQASSGGRPFIATKSLGDLFRVGLLGNTGLVLQSNLYDDALDGVDGSLPGQDLLPDAMPNPFPHLLLGLDLGDITLGAELFWEWTGAAFDDEEEPTVEFSGSVRNIGGIFGANIALGDLLISPLAGFGLPAGSGEAIKTIGNVSATEEYTTTDALYAILGAELGVPLFDADWYFGGFYTMESYQNKPGDDVADTNALDLLNTYAGFVAETIGDLLFAGQYSLNAGWSSEAQTDQDRITTLSISHIFATGVEKSVESIWIFDNLFARGGASLTIRDTVIHTGEDRTSRTPISIGTLNPTVGLGLTRGKWVFDILSVLGGWPGLVSGPRS